MKIETPQILWHATENGKNAPLLSLSILQQQCKNNAFQNLTKNGQHIMATSGNTTEVNLWKVTLDSTSSSTASMNSSAVAPASSLQEGSLMEPQHLLSLTRNQRSTNAVAFSPNGETLATAGDGGSILLYSIQTSSDQKDCKNIDWWFHLEKESDLHCHILKSSPSEDVMDLQWGKNSKRFVVGCLDHEILVYEKVVSSSSTPSSDANVNNSNALDWKCIWRKRDHLSYVQGVAWDPLGNYLASQGSDRTIKVYSRKIKSRKSNTEKAQNAQMTPNYDGKFDMGKPKTIKYYQIKEDDNKNSTPSKTNGATSTPSKRNNLFADESTVESFFRRLSWTPDGAFLIAPTALWHTNFNSLNNMKMEDDLKQVSSPPSFATCLFARHRFDKPAVVLSGLDKPSIAVKANPIPFAIPNKNTQTQFNLSYRTIFAVLTIDTVLIYDTYHFTPLAVAQGLHYAGLTDCEWTRDGRHLIVSSSDGYISILSFEDGELGEVYKDVRDSNSVAAIKEEEKNEIKQSIGKKELKPIEQNTPVPEMKMMVVKKKTKEKKRALLTPGIVDVTKEVHKEKKIVTSKETPEINVLQVKKKDKKRISVTTVVEHLEAAKIQKETKSNLDPKKTKKRRIQVTNLSAL